MAERQRARRRDRVMRVRLEPATAYEAMTRQMLESLTEDVREVRGRVNGLLFMVAGGIVMELATRLLR